jgi:hypothetical protein
MVRNEKERSSILNPLRQDANLAICEGARGFDFTILAWCRVGYDEQIDIL